MSMILIKLTQLLLFLSFIFFLLPKTTLAANCTFTFIPDPPNQNMGDLGVTITSNDLAAPDTYRIQLVRTNITIITVRDIDFTSGTATATLPRPSIGWPVDPQYKLYFIKQADTGDPEKIAACQINFPIKDIPTSSSCVASIENKPIDPDTGVVLAVNGINPGTYDIFINGALRFTNSFSSSDRKDLDKFDVGFYTVTIKSACGIDRCLFTPARLQCNPVTFLVGARGSGEGGQVDVATGAIPAFCMEKPNDPKCVCIQKPNDSKCAIAKPESCGKNANDPGIKTAIGCIHTNPSELTKDLMTFIIGIGGGLAFLMMLFGAFQMLTSAGNPETLAAGRSRLTSAVIGLLFVIFAVLLMQIIGFDILKIPGFGR